MMLNMFFFLCVTLAVVNSLPDLSLDYKLSVNGEFEVQLQGASYFQSGPTYLRKDGRLFTTDDGSLIAHSISDPIEGVDSIGDYIRREILWTLKGDNLNFTTAIQRYASEGVLVMEQYFPYGVNKTASPSSNPADDVTSAWPSFALDPNDVSRAVVGWGGRFLEGSHALAWGDAAAKGLPSAGQHGGPMCLFDKQYNNSVVVSSLTQHAVSTSSLEKGKGSSAPSYLSYGLLGSITSIPAGFTLRTVISAEQGGPSAGMYRWGSIVRKYHDLPARPYDFTLDYLGYGTDNGQYYYYSPEKDANGKPKSYEDTLLDVMADAKLRDIPYRYIQLDSWWYPQGKGGGVVDWVATNKSFPHGLEWFHEQVKVPFYAHNRMWAAENVYAKQNGGAYDFIVEPWNQLAIPVEQTFWDDLLANASDWGMLVYEQ